MEKFRNIPWSKVRKGLESFGWRTEKDLDKVKIFVQGYHQLSLVKIGKNRWKVEFFFNKRLVDSLGINDETSAKLLAAELGVLRGLRAW